MRPYDIFNKVCPGGLQLGKSSILGDTFVGVLPSGRCVEIPHQRSESFMVGGKVYTTMSTFSASASLKYPEDKEVLLKHWQPKHK